MKVIAFTGVLDVTILNTVRDSVYAPFSEENAVITDENPSFALKANPVLVGDKLLEWNKVVYRAPGMSRLKLRQFRTGRPVKNVFNTYTEFLDGFDPLCNLAPIIVTNEDPPEILSTFVTELEEKKIVKAVENLPCLKPVEAKKKWIINGPSVNIRTAFVGPQHLWNQKQHRWFSVVMSLDNAVLMSSDEFSQALAEAYTSRMLEYGDVVEGKPILEMKDVKDMTNLGFKIQHASAAKLLLNYGPSAVTKGTTLNMVMDNAEDFSVWMDVKYQRVLPSKDEVVLVGIPKYIIDELGVRPSKAMTKMDMYGLIFSSHSEMTKTPTDRNIVLKVATVDPLRTVRYVESMRVLATMLNGVLVCVGPKGIGKTTLRELALELGYDMVDSDDFGESQQFIEKFNEPLQATFEKLMTLNPKSASDWLRDLLNSADYRDVMSNYLSERWKSEMIWANKIIMVHTQMEADFISQTFATRANNLMYKVCLGQAPITITRMSAGTPEAAMSKIYNATMIGFNHTYKIIDLVSAIRLRAAAQNTAQV